MHPAHETTNPPRTSPIFIGAFHQTYKVPKMLKHITHMLTFISPQHPPIPFALTTTQTFTTKTNDNSNTNTNINLNQQQKDILNHISNSKSVFITGPAGTGKTFLLAQVISLLKEKYHPSEVYATASTGIAAFRLKGQTIHSFAGLNHTANLKLNDEERKHMLTRVHNIKPAYWRWKRAKALVIDEVSMINGHFLDNLEYVARNVRNGQGACNEPWGGIQLIVSGDFYQLPPVNDGVDDNDEKEFAFQAECWKDSFDMQVVLTEIYRQKYDSKLIDLLHAVRRGDVQEDHVTVLQKCCSKRVDKSVPITHIFPLNDEVRRMNEERLKKLRGNLRGCVLYEAKDTGYEPWKSQLSSGIAPDVLKLVIGARVMLIKNTDCSKGLVNGATGTVVEFVSIEKKTKKRKRKRDKGMSDTGFLPVVQFDSGTRVVIKPEKWELMEGDVKVAKREQIPLILAWAISAHKCQGMTLDRLRADVSRAFGYGMVYAVISRVRSLDGLYLSGFDSSKIKAHPKVTDFYEKLSM